MNSKKYELLLAAMIAFVYQLLLEKQVQEIFEINSGVLYWGGRCIAFICTTLIICLFINVGKALLGKNYNSSTVLTVLYSVPYLLIVMVLFIMASPDITVGDEGIILENALQLKNYPEFHFLTSMSYVISLMLLPDVNAPIFLKCFVTALFCGYSVMRAIKHFKTLRYGILMYIPFLFLPVLSYTLYAHRIGFYFICYGYFFSVLLWDWLDERREITIWKIMGLTLLVACLAQWRPEGIPLIILSIPMILFVYKLNKKNMMLLILFTIVFNVIVYVPQSLDTFSGRDSYSEVRLHPFFSYKITNMLRCGLDREKNDAELKKIDKVISIEDMDRINKELGDENYSDGYIRWKEGYIGVRELYTMKYYRMYAKGEIDSSYGGFGSEEYLDYVEACKRIFIKNPRCFLNVTWGSFHYAAITGGKAYMYDSFARRIPTAVMFVFYNLYSVLVIVIFGLLYSIVKQYKLLICIFMELLMQAGMVFLLSPAGYFKYYFPIYFVVYYMSAIGIMCFIKGKSLNGFTSREEV